MRLCVIPGIAVGAMLVMVCACATVDPRADYDLVTQRVAEATGQARLYRPEDDVQVRALVAERLADGISADDAAQIALLNNPSLHAACMDVGMARADVVQAGLFSNPFVGVSARFPDGGGLANIEAGVALNLAELWQIPIRKQIAQRSLDGAILNLAQAAANFAADAKTSYYTSIGADERSRIAQENFDIASDLLTLATTRQQAGAATEMDVNLSRSVALNAEISVARTRLEAAEARRELAIVLGIDGDADALVLTDSLPTESLDVLDRESLVALAKRQRLDVQTAREAVATAEAQLAFQYRRVWPAVELGIEFERGDRKRQGGRDLLADTARASIAGGGLTAPDIQSRSERQREKGQDVSIGPSLGIEIPIFDQNQAQIAKAEYRLTQAKKTLAALEGSITHEVRGAVDRALTAWGLQRMYRDRSIPLAQANLDLSREAYRAGRASFLSVLEAQRLFLETRHGYNDASQSAATMIPHLERAIGLPFSRLSGELQKSAELAQDRDKETGS